MHLKIFFLLQVHFRLTSYTERNKTKGTHEMEQEKHYRHELKFGISRAEYLAIRERLRQVMRYDPHVSKDGTYVIRSIYFDNVDDKALREKIDGIAKREKFRIRYYNDDLSFITLEKKMKINDLCLKYDAAITKEELKKILSGDISWMKERDNELIREFYAKMNYQRLKPKVLVSYLREPFIYKAGNVRVTFDSDIRTSLVSKKFLESGIPDISATDNPGDMLLEVKYDAFIPEVIRDIVQVKGARQQAFSKYGACRRYI